MILNLTFILSAGLYFTVFPVEVDENVVDDDIRGRIKSRIEEEIWQKLKVRFIAWLTTQTSYSTGITADRYPIQLDTYQYPD